MKEYERLTERRETPLVMSMWGGTSKELKIYNRLAELEDKIENGTLIEVDNTLIGQCVIGIHKHTNGTYSLDLDENLVIGFADNGIVSWNNSHGFNDWFSNDLYFIANEQGKAEAEKKFKELKGE